MKVEEIFQMFEVSFLSVIVFYSLLTCKDFLKRKRGAFMELKELIVAYIVFLILLVVIFLYCDILVRWMHFIVESGY